MALKVSGGHKGKSGLRSYPDFDTISEGVPYPDVQPGSSSSTPAWDYTRTGHRATRFSSAFGGDHTPVRPSEAALEEDEQKEWIAQVEPGVQITFVSLPRGGNDLKRIRFRYIEATISSGCCLLFQW